MAEAAGLLAGPDRAPGRAPFGGSRPPGRPRPEPRPGMGLRQPAVWPAQAGAQAGVATVVTTATAATAARGRGGAGGGQKECGAHQELVGGGGKDRGGRSATRWCSDGGDASKMHLLFQALCLTICSKILPYLNKTAVSDAVFSKVSLLAIFAGNKIGEKYHVNIYGKKLVGQKMDTRGCRRTKRGGPTRLEY